MKEIPTYHQTELDEIPSGAEGLTSEQQARLNEIDKWEGEIFLQIDETQEFGSYRARLNAVDRQTRQILKDLRGES